MSQQQLVTSHCGPRGGHARARNAGLGMAPTLTAPPAAVAQPARVKPELKPVGAKRESEAVRARPEPVGAEPESEVASTYGEGMPALTALGNTGRIAEVKKWPVEVNA